MTAKKALIVDDDESTTQIITATLDDARMPWELARTDEEARQLFQGDEQLSLVFLRGFGAEIHGLDLCREFRRDRTARALPVLILLRDEELVSGADFLIAGANDLLIGFLEPRELRMRACIVPADQVNRMDDAHTSAAPAEPKFFVPQFDRTTLRFGFGANESTVDQWMTDPRTRQVPLDRLIVCPECEAVPTFRPGCGACGSAWVEQEILIHHYACAHVAPESEFRGRGGIDCPKCRLADLVAGADFEQIQGCLRCSDCDAIFTETKMIGHCLACQHRFESRDGVVVPVYGYEVGSGTTAASIPAPNFSTSECDVSALET